MKSVPVLSLLVLISLPALASSDAILIKDAPACKRAGSFSEIAAPYVAAQTRLNAEREKAEKEREKQRQAANTQVMPGQMPNGLPPGAPTPPGQTGFVPQWKPGQAWTPGATAFKPQTPPTTSVPTPSQPAMPGQPVGGRSFPRPVGCGKH